MNRIAAYGTPENSEGKCVFCHQHTVYQMSLERVREQIINRLHVCMACAEAIRNMAEFMVAPRR